MKVQTFLANHPVFRADELWDFLNDQDTRNIKTRENLLAYYVKTGCVLKVRRGLYAVVPPGQNPAAFQPDQFLVAAKMAPDAVLAYHTALEFYGRAYTTFNRFFYLTSTKLRPFSSQGNEFRGVLFPGILEKQDKQLFGVEMYERSGVEVRVTSLERTLVDVLDRPAISGGWEEIWRSLESVPYFDLDKVVEYALLLGNSTTVAKVGFYLEQHAETLFVEESHLHRLRSHIPRKPHYMDRSIAEPTRFVEQWNLVVPVRVIERSWEEIP